MENNKYFLIQEFDTEEARDKALNKVPMKISCYFSGDEHGGRDYWIPIS